MATKYYVAQEQAMAPGIVKDWPTTIQHPHDKNGRLKLIEEEDIESKLNLYRCLVQSLDIEWLAKIASRSYQTLSESNILHGLFPNKCIELELVKFLEQDLQKEE